MLVDAGAEVIKVERPDGDPLRRWSASGAALSEGKDGALFQYLNASKRSTVLDLTTPAGRDALLDLVADADWLVESEAPGTLEGLGLGLDALQARNPRLTRVSITPWGSTGPWSQRPCTEFTLQAATGSIAYRGLPDRHPVAAGGRLGEWIAGTFGAVGAMSAFLSARRTGTGQHVDLSMFEAMLLCMTIYHDLNGQWVEGPLARAIEIPSVEPARDGWVGFCAITGQQWKDFCVLIGRSDVGDDDKYLDGRQRMANLDFIRDAIHSWTRERSVDEIIETASLMRIPVAPVGNGETLPETDHMMARGVFVENPGGFVQPRVPYLLKKTPLRPIGAAPRLGESKTASWAAPRAKQSESGDGASLPLEGLRVVDMSAFWAGPVSASYLADMGADVVKVESIHRPDGMRFAGAIPGEKMWEWSPVFHGANPGKRAITLDLDNEKGMALVKRLIADADVVMENYSPRVFENFGLGWETIQELNPRAIMLRMPAFGLDGPWRDRNGFAMTIEQASGLAWITGYRDLPLVVRGACDPLGGMHAVFALMMALEHRSRTGEGQLVEVPLLETALNVAAEQVIEHSAYGALLERDENRGPVSAPQGVYACAGDDAFVAVAVETDEQWLSLCRVVGNAGWAGDDTLATAAGRRARHDEIDAVLSEWFKGRERDAAAEELVAAGIPASALQNPHFVMPNPQLEHRRFFQTLKHPVTGETRYPGFPMGFSSLGPQLHRSPPPTLGQHNDEVLGGELGLSRDELEALREAKVIGDRPSFM
jgi:crotonobetainyl-CoA:carnitine CoA-transferase CaiB-like acyl-CoA transferase